MQEDQLFEQMGFELEFSTDAGVINPLLTACGLDPLEGEDTLDQYLLVTTRAGGVAACVGWTTLAETAVIHSLAVAPSTRGSSVGAALLASALHEVMAHQPVASIYLRTKQARHFFSLFGFAQLFDEDTLPDEVAQHPSFADAQMAQCMAKHYQIVPRGLDKCAFRLIHNATPEATLPLGSVLFYKQSNNRLEATYRGGTVVQGHMLGHIQQDTIDYLWHSYLSDDQLTQGSGHMIIKALEDGRRELREVNEEGEIQLILREA